MTPRLLEILRRAEALSRENGDANGVVGVEHVVLAAYEDEKSVPAQVLARRGRLDDARDDLAGVLRANYGWPPQGE
jgi:hypothetical protein